jgi:hypothetical protein
MHHTARLRLLLRVSLCLLVLLTVSLSHAAALPAGLLAWWSGDSTAQDESGHGLHATLVHGALAGVPGRIGGAFQFDGVDDLVVTPLRIPPQGTIDLWINPAALTAVHGILGTFGSANGDDRLWIGATGALGGPGVASYRMAVNLGSRFVNDLDIPSPLVIGQWTHLALTFNYLTDQYTLYVDGHAAATSTAVRTPPTFPLDVGGLRSDFGQNFFFQGLLDEVHVFERVLTPTEIQELATPLVPFAAFTARVDITHSPRINDGLELQASFTLGTRSNGINLATDPVTLQLTGGTGDFTLTIPPSSWTQDKKGRFKYEQTLNGVQLAAQVAPLGGTRYELKLEGAHANLTGVTSPVTVTLTIGNDRGSTVVRTR